MDDLDCLSVEKLVAKIEAKETARNALNSSYTSSAGISSFRKCEESKAAEEKKLKIEIKCLDCDNKIKAYIRGRQNRLIEQKWCKDCYLKAKKNKEASKKKMDKDSSPTEDAALLLKLGGVSWEHKVVRNKNKTAICLDHHTLLPDLNKWKRSSSLPQPLLRISVSINPEDYKQFGLNSPEVSQSFTDSIADTGAQSYLMSAREEKWQRELGCTFHINFWTSLYKHTANIGHDNRMKWLQYQINRNSLFTNYKVHKFNPQVSPMCTFCLQEDSNTSNLELVSHLFAGCNLVHNLWTGVGDWLGSLGLNLELDRKVLLFGIQNEPFTSVINYIILSVKYYIWFTRIKNEKPNLLAYKKYLFHELEELKNAYIYEKKDYKFDKWIFVFSNIST